MAEGTGEVDEAAEMEEVDGEVEGKEEAGVVGEREEVGVVAEGTGEVDEAAAEMEEVDGEGVDWRQESRSLGQSVLTVQTSRYVCSRPLAESPGHRCRSRVVVMTCAGPRGGHTHKLGCVPGGSH